MYERNPWKECVPVVIQQPDLNGCFSEIVSGNIQNTELDRIFIMQIEQSDLQFFMALFPIKVVP